MDDLMWKGPFREWPNWPCPSCQRSPIRLIAETLKTLETGSSERAHGHEAWEPEWIQNRFFAAFRCIDPNCGEIIHVVGDSALEEYTDIDYLGNWNQNYRNLFHPIFFHPPVRPFSIIDECPQYVKIYIERSFALIWSDIEGAINSMRKAVEEILTDKKIPRFTTSKSRKRTFIHLHARIDKYKLKDPTNAKHLEALKWVGNSGSHSSNDAIDVDHLIDSYKVLELIIKNMYSRNDTKVRRISTSLLLRKGKPLKKRRNISKI